MKKIIIAIDGHSSCGKSTMAKSLAQEIGYIYIDTGAMYRAVTLYALRCGMIEDTVDNDGERHTRIDEKTLRSAIEHGDVEIFFRLNATTGLGDTYLCGECVESDIRGMEVSSHVSLIAALPFVRTFLVSQQQSMGLNKGIVMDGRDIGTTVFPQAELKIFVTADDTVRAQRRFDEMVAKGDTNISFEDVLANVRERDYIDTHRQISPLRQASDALVLDNSHMSREEQSAWLLARYKECMAN